MCSKFQVYRFLFGQEVRHKYTNIRAITSIFEAKPFWDDKKQEKRVFIFLQQNRNFILLRLKKQKTGSGKVDIPGFKEQK